MVVLAVLVVLVVLVVQVVPMDHLVLMALVGHFALEVLTAQAAHSDHSVLEAPMDQEDQVDQVVQVDQVGPEVVGDVLMSMVEDPLVVQAALEGTAEVLTAEVPAALVEMEVLVDQALEVPVVQEEMADAR